MSAARENSTARILPREKGAAPLDLVIAVMAFLAALAVTYFWDAQYNNGRLTDGLVSMGQSMSHSMLN